MTQYKPVVLGGGAVGKSSLTIQFTHNQFVEIYDPTIEDFYRKTVVIDSKPCLLEILDTAGQDDFTCLRGQHIRGGEAYLLVYSITNRQTFEEIDNFVVDIERQKDKDINEVPVVLVGNKRDLEHDRQVSREVAKMYSRKLGCPFFETSAKTGENVEECFEQLIRQIIKQDAAKLVMRNKQIHKRKVKRHCTIV